MHDDRDELDGILDRALPAYSGAEPLAGLEQRVLQRISAANGAQRKLRFWAVAIAFAGVAVLAILVAGSRPKKIDEPAQMAKVVVPVAVVPHELITGQRERKHVSPTKWRHSPAAPTLTDEERALLALVQSQPVAALQVAEMGKRAEDALNIQSVQIQSIQIQPIQMEPLEIDGSQSQ